jgi:apolipoprotein N-acyltransferase
MPILFLFFAFFIYVSWYHFSIAALLAWIPLYTILNSGWSNTKIISGTYVLFAIYNLVVTFWLIEFDAYKGATAIVINSFLMELVVVLSLFIGKNNRFTKNFAFIVSWLAFEYIHHIWFFTWPWLTLGNTFSIQPIFVQWYKFTGVLGGSVWILVANLCFYKQLENKRVNIITTVVVLLPIAISTTLYFDNDSLATRRNRIVVAVMLTNFSSTEYVRDSTKLALAKQELLAKAPKNMDYVLLPETYFREDIWTDRFESNNLYQSLKQLSKTLKTKIISGFFVNSEDENGIYQFGGGLIKFNQFNTAIQIDTSNSIPIKFKKVFIPFQEHMPRYLSWFSNEVDTNFKLLHDNKDYFNLNQEKIFISICYESVNGIFFSDRWTDENVIFMIASEAFLRGNSIAMQQYQNICRLRAIEFSKFLFKSSNAGISSVIDERGEVVTFKRASKSVELLSCVGYTNNVKTFYSTWGWVTNKLPVFVLVILILFIIFLPVIGSKSKFVA